ncbi:Domain of unknown function DUF3870 [Moorella glycerini]|uniref:DUF3870 domain-containing protein n=1 Tax=Neomoorella stamsii TaxID=1266720 RepID=A0A9X7J5G3_9FIRM|nr:MULTISPECIES: DUF3870 domain-containing protein [Moorella]PRR76413.1 hypothetical protein MOST_05810 [Moorella stamsii]CEP67018.1 Domain of unknown function DUF3870 [Moorella glycerini]
MKQLLFFTGQSKFPQGVPAKNMYDLCTVSVEIEPDSNVIIRASCTLANEHGRAFISSLLIGYCLEQGIDDIVAEINERYFGTSKNAVIAALKDLYRKYSLYNQDKKDKFRKIRSTSGLNMQIPS